ncbi:DUF4249 domain-containing protein [Adhaeribacter sp. BT258]|uniref:DUF4249 domain-containing protein n=1 Tax=Adhaeribacter terrigena TaxID=2793070 RepID=A0ABS1C0T9_9BACT|nr:DUF4249 domain-containing protein [Adhaeribacter terrigena]MBK0403032.1 DUF4249 domain-containing protein [Adhaeribacter terrigena]
MRFVLLALFLGLSACEKVLDIDLKDAEPRIIIEANLSDQPGPHSVIISRSVGFNDLNDFPMVRGAKVTLTDNAGNSEDLLETKPGIYQTSNFMGVPGRTYVLNVLIDGVTYSAISVMPQPVPILKISTEPFQFEPSRTAVKFEFQEPGGIKNYYRAMYRVNDTLSTQINVFSDEFNDGKYVDEILIDMDLELDPGDSVNVKLQAIDEYVFRFHREQSRLDNSQSSSPANPKSTFTNGALGYFSAHAETSAGIVVP